MSFSEFGLLLIGGMFAVCLISIVIRMTIDTTKKPRDDTPEHKEAVKKHEEAIKKRTAHTKTLVVGQEVYMFCGSEYYGLAKGKVVKTTPEGMEVLVVGKPIIRLDNNGIELEMDRRKRHGFEPGVERGDWSDPFMQSVWYGAPECGPWQLDDMSFEERTAKIRGWGIQEEGRLAGASGPDNQRNPYRGTENAEHWDRGLKYGSEYRNRSAKR
jgi:hypothetical protein